jgi:hypothetical protein
VWVAPAGSGTRSSRDRAGHHGRAGDQWNAAGGGRPDGEREVDGRPAAGGDLGVAALRESGGIVRGDRRCDDRELSRDGG